MSKKEAFVCGLDVGTQKICLLVAQLHSDDRLELISSGYAESKGLKKGVVVDLEEAAASIRKAAEEAEIQSGFSIDWVMAGISGDHVQSVNAHSAVPVTGKNGEVAPEDVAKVVQAAQSVPLAQGREIIHILPQEYFLDQRGDIRNPVGLTGSRLDVDAHVVTCETTLVQNLINAVNRAQMRVRKVVLQQLASAEAVLTRDERELGVALVDMGAGTTDIAIYAKSAVRSTMVLPVGGDHFTRDLAIGLRTRIEEAERIKKELGSVLPDEVAQDEFVEVPAVDSRNRRNYPRRHVCEILRARAIEVLELVRVQIARSVKTDQLIAGVVLTGGASMLEGMMELAEQTLGMPVRQGLPDGLKGMPEELLHPIYSTAVGLALFGAQEGGWQKLRPAKADSAPWFVNRFLSWVGS